MADETPEQIVSVAMAPDLIATWKEIATPVAIKRIVSRNPGQLNFFPSEASELAAAAQRQLPPHNDLTGIDVATKFATRIGAYIPAPG